MIFSKTKLHVVCPWHGFEFDIRTGVHPGNSKARLRKMKVAVSDATFAATRGGGLTIALDVTAGQAFLVEAIATFFLVFVVFGTVVDSRGPKIGGLAIGFVVAADILAIGPLTGASMNPARSFGPAVASGIYEAQLLYLVAPIVGALVSGLLYEYLFMRRGREPVDHGELKP